MAQELQEVNLQDLWRVIVQQKRVIFITWAICVALGIAYVMLATPVYKAEVFMLPPSAEDIQPLNISALANITQSSSTTYGVENVYALFVQMLKSRALRRSFFEENQIAMKLGFNEGDDPDVFFDNNFNKRLKVTQNKKQEEKGFVTISFEAMDPSLVTMIANSFVDKVANVAAVRLVNEVNSKVNAMKTGIKELIQGKKSLAKVRREDRVVALLEAVKISRALGGQSQQLNPSELAVNTEELPLYMINELVLQAEVDVLKARKDDAPFIEGLRDLEESFASLEQVSVNQGQVKAVFIDQRAKKPSRPIKPKKLLIVVLASLLGLVFGVIVAMVSYSVRKGREV